jgi:hypothetical protein
MQTHNEFDPASIAKEAAMFYGLFLRGHDVAELRQDIELPRAVVEKLKRRRTLDAGLREDLEKIYAFRRQVLAIFDELVDNERLKARLQ